MAQEAGGAAGAYLMSGGVPGPSDEVQPPKTTPPKPPAIANLKTEDYMKKHKFTHTHIEHHNDGSHTVHHVHQDGPHKDVKGAVADHDGMMDHMMDHTGMPNAGEGQDEAGKPLVAPPGAGAPPQGA